MTRIPSTKALRAFEAAARLGTIKDAAGVLSVSPSALSRRIQALEEELGQPLFERNARGLVLTEVGRFYAERLNEIFQSLADATDLAKKKTTVRLKMLAPPSTTFFLMQRIKEFEAENPGVQLSLDSFPGMPGSDRRVDEADIVVLYGNGRWPEWDTVMLTPGNFCVPACAPDFFPDGPPTSPYELAKHTWIRNRHFPDSWAYWCAAVGCPGLEPQRYYDVDSGLMGVIAAKNGLGIWLGGGFPAGGNELIYAHGQLVLAHSFHAFLGDTGFYVATCYGAQADPLVQTCKAWVCKQYLGEAAQTCKATSGL